MEQVNRSRRRRSIRHLRRSSGLLTDSYTSSLIVEQPMTAVDDEEVSTYGSIWIEDGSQEKSCNPQVVNCAEDQILCAKGGDFVSNEQEMSSALNSYSELANKFLDLHNPVVHEECLTQCKPRVASIGCSELTSPSVNDIKSGIGLEQELSSYQQKSRSDMGGETQPHICDSSTSACIITNHFHESVSHDKHVFPVNDILSHSQNGPSTSSTFTNVPVFDQSICKYENVSTLTGSTHQVNSATVDSTKDYSECDIEPANSRCKSSSLSKEMRNNYIEQISERKMDSVNKAESRKDRRKSESHLVKPDISKHPDYEPKKRKRLSLKKIHTDTVEEMECHFVKNCAEKDIESKQNAHSITEVHKWNNESVVTGTNKACTSELYNESVVTGTNKACTSELYNESVVTGTNKACTSELYNESVVTGTNKACTSEQMNNAHKWAESQENFDFMDFEMSEDIFKHFDAEKHLPSPHKATAEKKSKQSKAKATRRSSRYFNLHEMPLSDLSLEQIPSEHLLSPKINFSMAESSKSCGEENKENTQTIDEQLDTPRNSLEDSSHSLLENISKLDESSPLDVAFIEEIVEDFANLCVNEKTCADISGLSHQTRQTSGGKRHSGIYRKKASSTVGCKDLDKNKAGITMNCQQTNNPERCLSSQSVLSSLENVSDNKENGQSFCSLISSTSVADIDMDELPSPGSTSDDIQPLVNSESKICMRVRQSRKSWGMCQQSDSNKDKKRPRQVIKQKRAEKQTLIANSQCSASVDDARVTAQSTDNTTSELSKSPNRDNDEDSIISPGLLCLYKNKNFVMPQPRSWETIKESPKTGTQLFSKQKRKCFLLFENGLTNAKLQRRHKKALDIYKKVGGKPVAVTDEEFERKMLDAQLLVESL